MSHALVVLAIAAYSSDLRSDEAAPSAGDAGAPVAAAPPAPEQSEPAAPQAVPESAPPPEAAHDSRAAPLVPPRHAPLPYPVFPRRVLDREPIDYSDKWYGWQTLTVDAVAIGLASVAILGSRAGGLLVPGMLIWMYGSPSVHFAHRNVGMGFASMGLHHASLTPMALYVACIFDRNERSCSAELAVGATLTLIPVTIALDAAVFAYERGPFTRARIRRRAGQSTSHLALAPWRDHARDAWGLELSGAF